MASNNSLRPASRWASGSSSKKHVRTPREARSQDRQLALPAAKVLHRTLGVSITEAEGVQVAADLALEAWSAQFREAVQEALLALQHTLHPAQVGCHLRRAELFTARVQLPLEVQDLRPRGAHYFHGRAFVALDVLGQGGHVEAPAADDLSPVDLLRTGEDTEHRGLASAVRSDQPDPRASVHPEVQAPEHGPSPVKLLYRPQPDEGHAALPFLNAAIL